MEPIQKIILILYSLFLGAFFPFTVFYLVAFYKKRKSIKQLILRFILLFFFSGIIIYFLNIAFDIPKLLVNAENEIWFIIPANIGVWGGIILFRIGYKRGLKHRASKIQKST